MTEVRPDWKTPPAEKDPGLLKEIWEAWQPFGCAICGARGTRIEVHHIIPRSQGGDDSWDNTMGLCSEFSPGKCHWRVTTNRVSIDLVAGIGYVWTDRVTHQEGVCRDLKRERIQVTQDIPSAPARQEELDKLEKKKPLIAADRLPEEAKGRGREAAERRFLVIQRAWRGLNRDLLTLSLLVYDVAARSEFRDLGFKSMRAYGDAIGIAPPLLGKMLKVAQGFQGAWQELPEEQTKDLTIDRLYFAEQLLAHGEYESREAALHAAIATPQRYLWEQVRDAQRSWEKTDESHRCPDCGFLHSVVRQKEQG